MVKKGWVGCIVTVQWQTPSQGFFWSPNGAGRPGCPEYPLGPKVGLIESSGWFLPPSYRGFFRFRFLELIWAIKVCRGFDPPFPPKRGFQQDLQDRRAAPPAAQPGPICGWGVMAGVCGVRPLVNKTRSTFRNDFRSDVTLPFTTNHVLVASLFHCSTSSKVV